MKHALCVSSVEDISKLVSGKSNIITTHFIDRDICENPKNNFLQIIPYVIFYTTKLEEGKILFVQYLRTTSGKENRLHAKTSIGFGGHIDQLEDIKSTSSYVDDEGDRHFVMNKDELMQSIFLTATREVIEELGVNVFDKLNIDVSGIEGSFFLGNPEKEVNQVHMGFFIPVKLTNEQFDKFFEIINYNKREIEIIDRMSLNIRDVIEEMDISSTFNKVAKELEEKHNLEDWSILVFEHISRKEISDFLKNVNYDDLYKIAMEKKARAASLASSSANSN